MESFSHYKYCSFDENNSILYHEVNNENFGSKESFILTIALFSSLIDIIKPKGIIIKVFKKPGFYELEMGHFMKSTLFRSIENAGVKKIAFFMRSSHIVNKMKPYERNDFVEGRFFSNLELAEQWIIKS